MKTALSIPCFISQFYPEVAESSMQLMEKLGIDFELPKDQTCCGQPLANSGYEHKAKEIYKHNVDLFGSYDMTLMISGSCTYHIKEHYDVIEQTDEVTRLRNNIRDLTEYILNECLDKLPPVKFPHKVALHTGCHSLRGMRFGVSSELGAETKSFLLPMVQHVKDIEIINLERPNECCGFGGTFSVFYDEISVRMGRDKLQDAINKGVEVLVSNDMSCFLHLEGIIKKDKLPIKVMHILQVLNGDKL
ncbi:MAG: (Fe-S)-binding protein [Bacteroidota bacterium]